MKTLNIKLSLILTAMLITLFGIVYVSSIKFAGASAPAGLPSTVATSTSITVGTTVGGMAFATSTCNSRIVTSRASALMLTFSDFANQTPTGTFGHLQPASTTVAYDSGLYGCGAVKIYAFSADTITITETR